MNARLLSAGLFAMAAVEAASAQQVPPQSDVASCTLIVDPTAQRLCIESARQSRPASTFDPTAQKQRMERRPPPGRDAMSPGRKREPTSNSGIAPGPAPEAKTPNAKTPDAKTPESYREDKWRLQIP